MDTFALWTFFMVVWGSLLTSLGSNERNGTKDVENRFLIFHGNPSSPFYRFECFSAGKRGQCVPLGMCPFLENEARKIHPTVLLQFLAPFTDACDAFGRGYCCPNDPGEVLPTEAVWTWNDDGTTKSRPKVTTFPPPLYSSHRGKTTTSRTNQRVTVTEKPVNPPQKKPSNLPFPYEFDGITSPTKITKKPSSTSPKPIITETKTKHKNRKLIPESTCGIDLEDKILGGNETYPGEYPWMALIQLSIPETGFSAFICGGSLISSRYVLTAAHCVTGPGLPANFVIDVVRLGEHDTEEDVDCRPSGECAEPQDMSVAYVKVHELYDPTQVGSYNDIALIRLSTEPVMNSFVAPICLPLDGALVETFDRQRLDTAGWGKTANGESEQSSTVKMKVTVPVVPLVECIPEYLTRLILLRDTQMCAGGEVGKDTCQGDSGGPLMAFHRVGYEFRWMLVGIVSTGPKICGTSSPAVYTRVSKYVRWILDNMRE